MHTKANIDRNDALLSPRFSKAWRPLRASSVGLSLATPMLRCCRGIVYIWVNK